MSKRRDLERHLHGLGEIKDIMNAMKNLALMETHKLTRVLATQQRVVASLDAAAADFLSFHPQLLTGGEPRRDVSVLIGSERGFCGDFNESLLRALAAHTGADGEAALVAIGSRLAAKLVDDPRVVARLDGPSVLEEVETVLLRLMETLNDWQAAQSPPRPLRLTVFHHQAGDEGIARSVLQPFRQAAAAKPGFAYEPLLNLEPPRLLTGLAEHYLFAALHGLFYGSLMAENQRRMQHMDYAVRRIEQQSTELLRKCNSLRQEEITEEIEVIMLSVETS
jgi:F-type H+-transporting ATPase subunit gamma